MGFVIGWQPVVSVLEAQRRVALCGTPVGYVRQEIVREAFETRPENRSHARKGLEAEIHGSRTNHAERRQGVAGHWTGC